MFEKQKLQRFSDMSKATPVPDLMTSVPEFFPVAREMMDFHANTPWAATAPQSLKVDSHLS